MPTASDELRGKMKEYFGDSIDDWGPTKYLREQGHQDTRQWTWKLRPGLTWETLPQKDRDCINFLCDEWDWGGTA